MDEPYVLKMPPMPTPVCSFCEGTGRMIWYVDNTILSMWTGHRVVEKELGNPCICTKPKKP